MRSLALIALLGMMGCEAAPQYEHVHASTLTLKIGNSGCSGTAVGRYTILTATHCIAGHVGKPDRFATLTANGRLCEIWKAVDDGNDHALLTVSCEFKAVAELGKGAKAGRTPALGTKVFMFGSPLDFTDLLRFGRVAGNRHIALMGTFPLAFSTAQLKAAGL
ncbi:MAG: hypothetical protein A3E01_07030 [Gammaproteobacteria bacterium RIFCSPHIGHO2_12_FULL_63_22]|nr:MAG: hypothetical protein A3E01_07030 [Gammaproteobacteria bacterium RIFCSPHIGHO2_12_FULL_63_22]